MEETPQNSGAPGRRDGFNPDPRARRSWERLSTAILALAQEGDPERLTAAQVSAAAGVNRSTFYQHASSPPALLRAVLSAELDAVRTAHLQSAGMAAAVEALTLGVIHHLDAHRQIYRKALGPDGGASGLHTMLGAHFEQSALLMLEQRGVDVRGADGRKVAPAVVAKFLAYGMVGAFEVRLLSEELQPEAEFMADLRALLPQWWPLAQ